MKLLSLILTLGCLISQIRCDGAAHSHVQTVTADTSDEEASVADASNDDAYANILKTLSDNPSLAAAAASAAQGRGGYSLPASGGYNYPPPPSRPVIPGFPGGFGGIPGFGFGKGFNLNVGAEGGGYGVVAAVIAKVLAIVGAGILVLLILAFLHGSILPGGFLNLLGGSFSKALAGAVDVNIGPIHESAAGSAAINLNDRIQVGGQKPNDPRFNNRVQDSINRRF